MRTLAASVTLAAVIAVHDMAIPRAEASADGAPTLVFSAFTPVTIEGRGFRSGERIELTLSLQGSQRSKSVRASIAGAFTVSFADAVIQDRCNSDVWARATSLQATRASAKLPQLHCPPAL